MGNPAHHKFARLISIIGLLLACLFLFGAIQSCNSGNDNATQPLVFDPLRDQFEADAINIASITSVASRRDAVLLGVKAVNDAGGVLGKRLNSVSLVSRDIDEALNQAQSILMADIKTICVSTSSRSKAVSEITIPLQIPLISDTATSPFFTDYADNDFYFRMVPSDVNQARILAELAIAEGFENLVTVHNQGDQYGETLVAHLSDNFSQLGGEVLAQVEVPFAVTVGFDPYLQIIAEQSPPLIFDAILDPSDSATFVNEAIGFGLDARFLFADASTGDSNFAMTIANVNAISDALGTTPGFGLETNPDAIYFEQQYLDQYGRAADGFNVNSYDFVLVTALAIARAGQINNTDDPTPLMVRDSLRAVMNPPGEIVGPQSLARAFELIAQGAEVDFSGAYGAIEWDNNGDVAGEITYDVMSLDPQTKTWQRVFQQQIFIPLGD